MQSNDNDADDFAALGEEPNEYEVEASNEYEAEASAVNLSGHLMRVRVRKLVWRQLQVLAEEEAERLGCHVTASDIVRAAVANYLGLHESLSTLRSMPPSEIGDTALVFEGVA